MNGAKSHLERVNSLVSDVNGIDKIYRCIDYTSKLLAWHMERGHARRELIERVSRISMQMSNIRYVLRLFGTLNTIQSIGKNYGAGEETDFMLKFIARLQIWSLLVFYPLEHIYWLSWQEIYPFRYASSFSLWSCRAWAFYILLDLIGDGYRLYLLTYEKSEEWKVPKLIQNTLSSPHMQEKDMEYRIPPMYMLLDSRRKAIYWRCMMNLCDLPLAIAWSFNNDLLPPLTLSLCGCISSLIGLYMKWHRC
jgi:hypothetical protein